MPDEISLEQRMALGKEGKLRRVRIYYAEGKITKSIYQDNLTGPEIMEFCERIYQRGMMLPIDPGHWRVIAPFDIQDVHIYKQDKFYDK